MSDKEILDKYVDLDKSCLTDEEKKQVMDMLCIQLERQNRHLSNIIFSNVQI